MPKIVSLNLGNFGSTGRIAKGIVELSRKEGYDTYFAYPDNRFNVPAQSGDIRISSDIVRRINERASYYTGHIGCFSFFTTYRLIKKLKKIKPDIIHLHNIHNSYVNHSMLFRYIKKHNVKTVWTLHDCWSFTGQCPYFTLEGCEKWKGGCYGCSLYKQYPATCYDNTKKMWKLKKKWFTGVENMTLVTPSLWLSKLVKQSFLKEYPVCVINNGIDLSVFKPTESDFRKKYGLEDKFVILGIAFDWGIRKGLDVFLKLAGMLGEEFAIVLVGTTDEIDKQLPDNIISIHRTSDQKELAEIYTACDVFVNPTREDNFPTVNIEALACGTPVITFNTGGSVEIPDETCGAVVECEDVNGLFNKIHEFNTKPKSEEKCLLRAQMFDKDLNYEKYIALYKEI